MTTLPEALRLAEYLRFPAHCPNEYVRDRQAADELIRLYEENEKLRAALAEPEDSTTPIAEPVGWLEAPHGVFRANPNLKHEFPPQSLNWRIPLYALAEQNRAWYTIDEINAKFDPKPVQEPVQDWSLLQATQESLREHMAEIQRLRAAPPQRKPLTDEEIEKACVPLGAAMLSFTEVARAIERAHGITGPEDKGG